jgi:hypothetical protein
MLSSIEGSPLRQLIYLCGVLAALSAVVFVVFLLPSFLDHHNFVHRFLGWLGVERDQGVLWVSFGVLMCSGATFLITGVLAMALTVIAHTTERRKVKQRRQH